MFPTIIRLLEWKQILDTPDKRKIHEVRTPSMGGIPIFIATFFSLLIWLGGAGANYKYLFSALTIFFIIGLRDDLIPMKPTFKLLSQLVPILLVVIFSDVRLTSFYSLLDLNFNNIISILITSFTLIVITNSFNLIDGIDGLAGTIGSLILLSFGAYFYITGLLPLSFLCFAITGSLIAFLIYNWSPSRIFMGDTGALLIGFLIGCLAIYFININFSLEASSPYKFHSSISTAICIMIIPLTDTIRIFTIRVLNSKSPLSADSNHIHHELIKLGLNHSQSTLILGLVNLGFIGLAYFGREISDRYMLLLVLFIASSLLGILKLIISRKAQTQKRSIQ